MRNINTENTWIIHKTVGAIYRGRAVDGKLKSNLEWPNEARAAVHGTPLSSAWILRDVVQWTLRLHGHALRLSHTIFVK